MTRPLLYITIVCLLLLLTPWYLTGQVYSRPVTIAKADGLSDRQVNCVLKDKQGFIWIGTANGLNRYDGHSFKIFRPGPGNSISNEVINALAEDSKGNIWVGTMRGLNRLDPNTGQWTVIMPDPERSGTSIPNFIVWDLLMMPGDKLWIVPDVFQLTCLDISTGTYRFLDWPSFANSHPVLSQRRYHSLLKIAPRSADSFWLASNLGLVMVDAKNGVFHYLGGTYRSQVSDLKYHAGWKKLFCTIETGQLYCYDEAESLFSELKSTTQPYPSSRFPVTEGDNLWMANEKGLLKLEQRGNVAQLERNIQGLGMSVLPGAVRCVYYDPQGLRWVGTSNGLSVYDSAMTRSVFLPLVASDEKENQNRVGSIFFDDSTGCYMVCMQEPAAFFLVNSRTGSIKKIERDIAGRPLGGCNKMVKDRSGQLWLLTLTDVFLYNRSSQSFHSFAVPRTKEESIVRDMIEDRAGNRWFALYNEGFRFYNGRTRRFEPAPDSVINHFSTASGIAELDNGSALFFSTFGEFVSTWEPGSGRAQEYYETRATPAYGPLSLVNAVAKDARGTIWIGTFFGGLFRYNPGQPFEKSFTRYDMRNGLTSNNILGICADTDTTLWLLTEKGIASFSVNGHFLGDLPAAYSCDFSAFGSDPRYPHTPVYNPSKKELLVGVGGGMFLYHTQPATQRVNIPMVVTNVQLSGFSQPVAASAFDSSFRLSYKSNNVRISFSGLYYGNMAGIHYQYRLEGYEEQWQEAGKSFEAVYQNLPPGSYRFAARALLPDRSVAGQVTGPLLSIPTPFWRTSWFTGLVLLLLVAIAAFVINNLQRKLRAEQIVSRFATRLYGQHTTEDILWDTARNCIELLGFVDCVIYLRQPKKDVLVQVAAYGPKNPERREIANKLELKLGEGIAGTVAKEGKVIRVRDTTRDPRYVLDDEQRASELAVPVWVDDKVFAVIDSEHPQKGFYNRFHIAVMKKIAAICGERISKFLNEERLRAKIARDLHDEMGSTLTSINIISKVAMEGKDNADKIKDYFGKIKDHSGRMMESMSDMVWAINPVNDNFEKVMLKMKEFMAEILEPARIHFDITEEGPISQTFLNPEQRRDIYLILKEAVNNTVKYSTAGKVLLHLRRTGQELSMEIIDDGKGFNPAIGTSGNGLRNMQERAGEMGARLTVESSPGKGTKVALILPLEGTATGS